MKKVCQKFCEGLRGGADPDPLAPWLLGNFMVWKVKVGLKFRVVVVVVVGGYRL